MPSDDQAAAVLEALAAPRDRFRSALASTIDEVRALLAEHRARTTDRLGHLAAEFGVFGSSYLDIEQLAIVIDSQPAVDPTALSAIQRASATLEALGNWPDGGVTITVPAGGSLSQAVAAAMADTGRAIGAGRVVALAREGRYRPAEHDQYLDSFPFELWSLDERRLAPPLVVSVSGADLRPSALAEFLDGDVKFVLIVHEPCTPAPLVRLITPRTFVAQATSAEVVARLAAWDGPGVVAIVPEGAAQFVHDPSAGEALADRLVIGLQPVGEGLHRVGPFTVAQQRDELQQLGALAAARAVAVPSAEAAGAPADDPVGKLASWLLSQADLAAGSKDRSQGR